MFWIASKIGSYLDKKSKNEFKPEQPKKVCPLHDWAWEEQIGVEPPTFFIRCQRCRRLPGWERET